MKETKGQNCIVLVEGGKSPIFKNLKKAVIEAGENGYITSLAAKSGIATFSPEPDDVYEVNNLLKKFTKDQIMFYYLSRLVTQWFNASKPIIKIHDQRRGHKFKQNSCINCLHKLDPDIKKVQDESVKIRDRYIYSLWWSPHRKLAK